MKTALEVINQVCPNRPWIEEGKTDGMIIACMKVYAEMVADQSLKEAAAKYNGITMKDDYGCVRDVPSAILSTPIITP